MSQKIIIVSFSLYLLLLNLLSSAERVSTRDPKWMNGIFPFFKVVIPPEPCGGSNSQVADGVCLPRGGCNLQGGTKNGDCAMGFGECCKFMTMCNASYHEIIVNAEVVTLNTQTPLDTDCTFEIRRKPKYCAVKLDFMQFMSRSADLNGTCLNDTLTIRGSNTVPDGFQTCGQLSGQHMYLTFGKSGSIEIIPSFSTGSGGSYKIIATQIPCISPRRVPDQCLQYYNSSRGVVKSFDFPNRQQSSQEYTVCVGGITNPSSITWKPCSSANAGNVEPFNVITTPVLISPTDWDCRGERDWVQINGLNQMCQKGNFGNLGVRSTYTPFLLNVHFNDVEKQPLPCYEDVLKLTQANCMVTPPAPPTGDKCIYDNYASCAWDPMATPPSCSCTPYLEVFQKIEGDINNTGFCLEYAQK